jgi:nitrite reductase (NADH) large subunit
MLACGARSRSGVVIGGGLLGLECAKALRDMQLDTHVVEFAPRLMAVQVDEGGGRVLRSRIEELGVAGAHRQEHGGHRRRRSVRAPLVFADGSHLETDMMVFSAGIRPRDELAAQSGLALGARGGIAIDNHCRTSDPDIYAIGECAAVERPGVRPGRAGLRHGPRRGRHLAGQPSPAFAGADMSTKLKLHGRRRGQHRRRPGQDAPRARAYQYVDERKQVYKKIVVSGSGKQLLGAVMVGDAAEYGTCCRWC